MGNASRRDATEESATPCFNVPLSSGSKRGHMTCPIPSQAFARNGAYVLSLARERRLECYELETCGISIGRRRSMEERDVIIVGAGPAGLSAGIFTELDA
ncbi:MAG: hypothetical protein KAU10_02025 [Dehalococcoidia bacterium]|nr:hypothetical protein [Dehalococcoidia bacterium]